MANYIDVLSSGNHQSIIELLYSVSGEDVVPVEVAEFNPAHLLMETDKQLIERLLFVYGLKCKRADLCDNFVGVFERMGGEFTPIASAVFLSLIVNDCRCVSRLFLERLQDALGNKEFVRQVGSVVLAWIAHMHSRITDTDRKRMLARVNPPSPEELLRMKHDISLISAAIG